ncbi:uncharacterized protein G2W53_036739 [Senna tora]|uniref:Uncharacterized protein n=1 Tax=Senna tora TaxID=362788 RepID=A0A834SUG7_9FABA|nr:uncharacterized protein G2W53_036739 [Senna tora]
MAQYKGDKAHKKAKRKGKTEANKGKNNTITTKKKKKQDGSHTIPISSPLRVIHEPNICSLSRQKKEQPNRNPELKKSK